MITSIGILVSVVLFLLLIAFLGIPEFPEWIMDLIEATKEKFDK